MQRIRSTIWRKFCSAIVFVIAITAFTQGFFAAAAGIAYAQRAGDTACFMHVPAGHSLSCYNSAKISAQQAAHTMYVPCQSNSGVSCTVSPAATCLFYASSDSRYCGVSGVTYTRVAVACGQSCDFDLIVSRNEGMSHPDLWYQQMGITAKPGSNDAINASPTPSPTPSPSTPASPAPAAPPATPASSPPLTQAPEVLPPETLNPIPVTDVQFGREVETSGQPRSYESGLLAPSPDKINSFSSLVKFVLYSTNYIVLLLLAVAFIVFVWGMIQGWVIGGASEQNIDRGKQVAIAGVVGFVVVLSLWGIVALVQSTFGF